MKRVMMIMMILVVFTLTALDESDIYNASGSGASTFYTFGDDGGLTMYTFGNAKDGIYYLGAMLVFNSDIDKTAQVFFGYFVDSGHMIMKVTESKLFNTNGDVTAHEKGGSTHRFNVRLIMHEGEPVLFLGEEYLFLHE